MLVTLVSQSVVCDSDSRSSFIPLSSGTKLLSLGFAGTGSGSAQWQIQDFLVEGDDYGERAEREPLRGSGGGAPSGVQGQSPGWGSGGVGPGSGRYF